MSKYVGRKFILALIFTVTGCAVFGFTSKLSGGEFVALASAILAAFTAGDAALSYIHRDKPHDGA